MYTLKKILLLIQMKNFTYKLTIKLNIMYKYQLHYKYIYFFLHNLFI